LEQKYVLYTGTICSLYATASNIHLTKIRKLSYVLINMLILSDLFKKFCTSGADIS